MTKSVVNIIDFPVLYNVLLEINDFLNFKVVNYENENLFLDRIQSDSSIKSSTIITKSFLKHKDIDSKNIIHLNYFPMNITSLIDRINTNLLKQKYNFQSNINIKNYILNLNSRVISQKKNELKLTEREIDIILFLKNQKKPQNISTLEREVWGYSADLETHTVETHVYRLRKKISDKFNDENFIVSEKEGYLIK